MTRHLPFSSSEHVTIHQIRNILQKKQHCLRSRKYDIHFVKHYITNTVKTMEEYVQGHIFHASSLSKRFFPLNNGA